MRKFRKLASMLLLLSAVACSESSAQSSVEAEGSNVEAAFVASYDDGSLLTNGDNVENAIETNEKLYLTSISKGNPSQVKWAFYLDGRVQDVVTATNDTATYIFLDKGVYSIKMIADSNELYYENWVNVGRSSSSTDDDQDDDSTSTSGAIVPDESDKEWGVFPINYVSTPSGKEWVLLDVSDEFNDSYAPTTQAVEMNGKWKNHYRTGGWDGPAPTYWQRDHVWIEDSKMKIVADRPESPIQKDAGDGVLRDATYTGCATSTVRVQYPVYIEAYAKLSNTTMASDFWLLSDDDTQEIDVIEAYGSDRAISDYFNKYRLHLSHHVFDRDTDNSILDDYQPSDAGSFYKDDYGTIWRDDYHRVGVFWRDPTHLYYYVDGNLVRAVNNETTEMIDPLGYTDGKNLWKEMDIIINMEDQSWRAMSGYSPTDEELSSTENATFNVEWIRAYQLIDAE